MIIFFSIHDPSSNFLLLFWSCLSKGYSFIHSLKFVILFFQSIPSDMEFDPNSNPPCYKTQDEVWWIPALSMCALVKWVPELYQCLFWAVVLKPRETPRLCISNCYCCIIATLFFRTLSYSKMMRYVLELWELESMLMISWVQQFTCWWYIYL